MKNQKKKNVVIALALVTLVMVGCGQKNDVSANESTNSGSTSKVEYYEENSMAIVNEETSTAEESVLTPIGIDQYTVGLIDVYRFNVDEVRYDKNGIDGTQAGVKISGWLIKPGTTAENAIVWILLRDTENNNYFVAPTTMVSRQDVTAFIADGCDYERSGFEMEIPYLEELDSEKDYEIFALYWLNEEDPVLIPLGATIKNWGIEG